MIVAFDAAASCTSLLVMPPTPRWTKDSFTSSRSSLRRASVSASSEPVTSALRTRLSVATSPCWICWKMSSRLDPAPGRAGDERIAHPEGAALNEDRGHGAATDVEVGLEHHAGGAAVGAGCDRRGAPAAGQEK